MLACLLANDPVAALDLYETPDEWHSAGNTILPLTRDLVMRAMVSSSDSERALNLLDQVIADRMTISIEALFGVLEACRNSGNWMDAVAVLFALMERDPKDPWLVPGDLLKISDVEFCDYPSDRLRPRLGVLLASVMHGCITESQPGLAMLCFRLFEIWVQIGEAEASGDAFGDCSPMVRSLLPLLYTSENAEELASLLVSALCALQCAGVAIDFLEISRLMGLESDADALHEFATEALGQERHHLLIQPWTRVHQLIWDVSAVHKAGLGRKDVANLLAAVVRSAAALGQPETSIHFLRWVESTGLCLGAFDSSEISLTDVSLYSDDLVSAAMDAQIACGRPQTALAIFDAFKISTRPVPEWCSTYGSAIHCLFALERQSEASKLFDVTFKEEPSPVLLNAVASRLDASRNHVEILRIYGRALSSGVVTEELAIAAMRSVLRSVKDDGRVVVLRNIAEEVAKLSGGHTNVWLESMYWNLRRQLGYNIVREVMGWKAVSRGRVGEINLAVRMFWSRVEAGMTPKADVIRAIVSDMGEELFHRQHQSFDEEWLSTFAPHIPTSPEEWQHLIDAVVQEANSTSLGKQRKFIQSVERAQSMLRRLHDGFSLERPQLETQKKDAMHA